jgi:transcriptional regulator with XRE-family HTH domain
MSKEEIALRLDEAMTARNLTNQSKLARISGVPQSTINRTLKGVGKMGPETETLRLLARTLAVNLRWLQEGIGPRDVFEGGSGSSDTTSEEAEDARAAELEREVALEVDSVLLRATEMLDTYRLASPTDRERIDLVIREIRSSLGNKSKLRTR